MTAQSICYTRDKRRIISSTVTLSDIKHTYEGIHEHKGVSRILLLCKYGLIHLIGTQVCPWQGVVDHDFGK